MTQGNGQHGGYRQPTNPAQTSGPGRFARRTDGQPQVDLPNAGYGENAAYQSIQAGAPVAGAPGIPDAAGGAPDVAGMLQSLVGLNAPTTQPGVPVTDGAALGPGAGAEVLGLPSNPAELDLADAESLRPMLEAMVAAASSPNATPSYRNLVRTVLQNLR
ncbi:hypothetical protein DDP54_15565 (plasmid) [Cellulomonas sp. WB94]|uniref:hypothetical protein n=1 Tax=Cellulomonas sp. WB94 TaxID=2173174 RepID=UPI000D571146|nr:hypothetical protein [Cellulomonas sp. WB94]PVU81318.1 hypothetical protein DDP54_15565 [Cellulomonas sp. WB94]